MSVVGKSITKRLLAAEIFAALDFFPFPASLSDSRNRFVAVNQAFTRLYIRPADSIAGRSPRLLTPGDFDEAFLQELNKATVSGGWSGRLPNCDARGRRFEVTLRTMPVVQSEGRYFLGVACRPGDEEALNRALLDLLWRVVSVSRREEAATVLSPRERQIEARLRAGQTYKEIACDLGLAHATVRVLAMRVRGKYSR